MPDTTENRNMWESYDWKERGDEWSAAWGGTDILWWGCIYPRIHTFVPAGSILEIAPGFGRCTQYLLNLCTQINLVDVTTRCIEACRKRFATYRHITYDVNDGLSLAMIRDESIDFAFSYDSLVHAEADVLRAYIMQLATKLRPDGVAFLHHSNLGAFVDPSTGGVPFPNAAWRAATMTATLCEAFCLEAGILCIGQELINWDRPEVTDCFSLLTLPGSRYARPFQRVTNERFMEAAGAWAKVAPLYRATAFRREG